MAALSALGSTRRGALWLLRPNSGALIRGRMAGTAAPGSVSASQPKLKTEEDLAEIKPLQMFYRTVFKGYLRKMHELQLYEKQLYGPIYKVRVGNFRNIVVNSAELLEELMRKDEKFPRRGDMSSWTEYRDLKGIGYGPLTEEGEKWYQLRTILNKRMLHPSDSLHYGDVINEVITDLIKRIYYLRQISTSGDMVSDLVNELYRFSLEGIASILFESRIGCLEKEIPVATQDFIKSLRQMFSNSMLVVLLPKWTRNILPFWGWYMDGWDGIFKFSRNLIDRKMEIIQHRVAQGQEVEGEYLTYLIASRKLSDKDLYGSITELLLAGVDSTANSLMWTLYLLSKNPEAQDRLYREVSSFVSGDRLITAQDVVNMPFLKAVIKEALRVYPVIPLNARHLIETDISIGGYYFPKNTEFTICSYSISHDEKIFPEPEKFKPERWIRDGRQRPPPFGSIPFGFGVRGCVGRRIAELEMYLSVSRIISLFEIKPDPKIREVKAQNRLVLTADRPLNLHFLERNGISSNRLPAE